MQKHPKIKAGNPSAHCPFTIHVLMKPMQLSPYAFNRHLHKQSLHKSNSIIKVYALPCGCFVWVYVSGLRLLSALPF
jgi:hypothetical protein